MNVSTWKDIIRAKVDPESETSLFSTQLADFSMRSIIQQEMKECEFWNSRSGRRIFWCELYISRKIQDWEHYPKRVHKRNGGSRWVDCRNTTQEGSVEAELQEYSFLPDEWLKMVPLLERKLSRTSFEFVMRYQKQFWYAWRGQKGYFGANFCNM